MTLSPFEWALIAHLAADWIFQNDWMAMNKTSLKHPASWVHAGIHGLFLGLALGWLGGLILGIVHGLIDTRVPLRWWQKFFRQSSEGYAAEFTRMMVDQSMHLVTIALWIAIAARLQIG